MEQFDVFLMMFSRFEKYNLTHPNFWDDLSHRHFESKNHYILKQCIPINIKNELCLFNAVLTSPLSLIVKTIQYFI